MNLDKATADALASDASFAVGSSRGVLKLGAAHAQGDGRWQRPLEIALQCDPDPGDEGCAIGGVALSSPLPRTVKLAGPSGADLTFAIAEVFPVSAPSIAHVRVRLGGAPEILGLVRVGIATIASTIAPRSSKD